MELDLYIETCKKKTRPITSYMYTTHTKKQILHESTYNKGHQTDCLCGRDEEKIRK